jgi:hypothetical protein
LYARKTGDKSIGFGHVTNGLTKPSARGGDVEAEDSTVAGGRGEQAQENLQEGGLARAIGTKKANATGAKAEGNGM